jgi:hypothetical protein
VKDLWISGFWADVQAHRRFGALGGWLSKQIEHFLLILLIDVAKTRDSVLGKGIFRIKQRPGFALPCSIGFSH